MLTRHIIEILIWVIIMIILISLIFHYKKEKVNESFSSYMNLNDVDNKTKDRLKLQFLINKYEDNYSCCNGYHQPSNSCAFSFNTNFYPGSYK